MSYGKTVAAAFVQAQKAFSPALKDSTNPHYKSKYADLSACINAVIDALNNNGIALMQPTRMSDNGVTVETVFLHESGEAIAAGVLHVPAVKQDAQGYGSALTYARRYSLMAACGIAPEDDDGNAASRNHGGKPSNSEHLDPLPEANVANLLRNIATTRTMDELKAAFTLAWNAAKARDDKVAEQRFVAAKDKRKAELAAPPLSPENQAFVEEMEVA